MLSKKSNKSFICLALFLLIAGIFIIAFHHHDDDCDHDDCPICAAAHQICSVIHNYFPFTVFYIFVGVVVCEKELLLASIRRAALNSRAPPV
jgi:hypothetical protein